jgi:2-polyprenyl-6-methoxyphenol hydroxylase-like FAD-dependent oxidoreductase
MQHSNNSRRKHAIVIGASLGGLLTARVLSSHFEKVTIVEKDTVNGHPESRKGQPQTRHLHGLLPAGLNIISHYFPGILDELKESGASVMDLAGSMKWYSYGGFKKQFAIGINGVTVSRPMLEYIIRKRVMALPNVELRDGASVKQLMHTADQLKVTGIIAEDKKDAQPEALFADLVTDASGRGSRAPQWLKEMGYDAPEISEVKVNVGYATRTYKRDPEDERGKNWILYTPEAPKETRFGGAFPIEDNRWIVTAGGWHGDSAPLEEKGYHNFIKELPNPVLYDIVKNCEPLSEIIQYKFPLSLRRHYEKLKRFPSGFLVLGDAITSFNPTYGQGMSSAALQVAELDNLLNEDVAADQMARLYFKRTKKIIDNIWQLATGEDFRFAETIGKRPPAINFINKYVARVHKAALSDEVVCGAFLKVMGLLKPPTSLFHPKILWRVLTA